LTWLDDQILKVEAQLKDHQLNQMSHCFGHFVGDQILIQSSPVCSALGFAMLLILWARACCSSADIACIMSRARWGQVVSPHGANSAHLPPDVVA
jgi:hypothetical protein